MQTTTDIIETVTEPAAEPLTVAELKHDASLNLEGNAHDAMLGRFIATARQLFEIETDGRIVIATVFRQHLTQWPEDGVIRLQRGKVTAVASVTYYDAEDELQTLNEADYSLDLTGIPGLVLVENMPALSGSKLRPITVQFTAGWADAASVPADVKQAVFNLAAHLVINRESHSETDLKAVPMGFARLCDRYRTGLKGF